MPKFGWIIPPLLALSIISTFPNAGNAAVTQSFTLGFGANRFISDQKNQWGNNSGWIGEAEYLSGMPGLLPAQFGFDARLAYDICPACDNTGGEYVNSYSLLAQFLP